VIVVMTVLLFVSRSSAQKVFEYTSVCQQAYKELTALKLNAGKQLIAQARQQNPDNLVPDFLESYIDFFELFFNEDPVMFEARHEGLKARIAKLGEGPVSSPFYDYTRAVATLHKAAVEIKFGNRWRAGNDFRDAFNMIKTNRKQFPTFLPNNLIYGPLEVAVGTIPKGYSWLTSLFGLKGNMAEGMKMIQSFLNSQDPWAKLFNNEACFYYAYLMFYVENKQAEAVEFIRSRKLDVVNNHLFTYMASNLGINNKQTEYGKNVILQRNQSDEYMHTNAWDLELGYAYLYHLDIPEAQKHFEKFIANFKGNFYLKEAYQKLSWCYYLQGNMAKAEATRKTLILKGNNSLTDADKKANKDAKTGKWPNVLLLKARLLNDGGYNKEALAVIGNRSTEDFTDEAEKIEFAYRVARIYDELNNDDKAIQAYLTTIKLGEKRTEHFASRAALQLGYIYERKGNKPLAIQYFEMCLGMENHDYKDSMDQKAKAGVARCKGQ
jgi:tetratricopeptide (TPR) repeat protein